MDKGKKNANAIVCKLRSALIRVTNHRLEVASGKRQKKEEIEEKRKIKAITTKQKRAKEGINLFSEKKESYKSNTKDKIDLNQANDKYLLQF